MKAKKEQVSAYTCQRCGEFHTGSHQDFVDGRCFKKDDRFPQINPISEKDMMTVNKLFKIRADLQNL